MRVGQICLFVAMLCVCASNALANSIPITGSFTDGRGGPGWVVQVVGPSFSISTLFVTQFQFVAAPPLGQTGTVDASVGISDYECAICGTPSDVATLDGVSGIAEGEVDFQVTYDPSPLDNPLVYAATVSGIPATFSGDATAYTCVPALPEGCFPGTELWSVGLSGSGDVTVTQSPGGDIYSMELDITEGAATTTDLPVPAKEPSSLLLTALALLPVFLPCTHRRGGA